MSLPGGLKRATMYAVGMWKSAYMVTMAALRNKQSLGCHYRVD